jgi:hypothetical protein
VLRSGRGRHEPLLDWSDASKTEQACHAETLAIGGSPHRCTILRLVAIGGLEWDNEAQRITNLMLEEVIIQ